MLFDRYPRPWTIVNDESVDAKLYRGGFQVFDALGETIIYGGTFTGDGDAEFNLNRLEVDELVKLVNAAAD